MGNKMEVSLTSHINHICGLTETWTLAVWDPAFDSMLVCDFVGFQYLLTGGNPAVIRQKSASDHSKSPQSGSNHKHVFLVRS